MIGLHHPKLGPLTEDHPMVTDHAPCHGCGRPFLAGEYVTLIALGPGDDDDARKAARDGRPYSAAAIPVHWTCATGEA